MKTFVHTLLLTLFTAFGAVGQPPASDQVASIEAVSAVESTLKIYPNPAKSLLTINMRLPSVTQARISLHDMLGNEVEVFSENASGAFDKTFDINSIHSGIYFVRIHYNNGLNTIVRKIVVQ